MRATFFLAAALPMGSVVAQSLAQSPTAQPGHPEESICILQKHVAEGTHKSVRVSGVYGPGLDHTVLEDRSCPAESTWVELDLHSYENKEKLRKLLERSRRAYVVLEGDFYGPPLPDSNVPGVLAKSYNPGWGHLAAFKTKLVVHVICDVKPVPTAAPETH